MKREVITLLMYNRTTKKYHLVYRVTDHYCSGPITYYLESTPNTIALARADYRYNTDYNGFVLIGRVKNTVNTDKLKATNKVYLLNCISVGKMLLGVKGLYLNPRQFFNKLKRFKGV